MQEKLSDVTLQEEISWGSPEHIKQGIYGRTEAEITAHLSARLAIHNCIHQQDWVRNDLMHFLHPQFGPLADKAHRVSQAVRQARARKDALLLSILEGKRGQAVQQLQTAMAASATMIGANVDRYVETRLHLPWACVSWDLLEVLWFSVVSYARDQSLEFTWSAQGPSPPPILFKSTEDESWFDVMSRYKALGAQLRSQQEKMTLPKGGANDHDLIRRNVGWLFRKLTLGESIYDLQKDRLSHHKKRWDSIQVKRGLNNAFELLSREGHVWRDGALEEARYRLLERKR